MARASYMQKGRICIEKSVHCGRCEHFIYTHGADELRGDGWKMTRDDGWICPECAAQEEPER